jgi:hypothetical protein
VRKFPEVVPEHLLVQIPEQVERLDADIGALQLALEEAPEVFETVGVHLSVNVFFRMVNDLVLETLLLESLIGHERIRVDRAPRFDVSANLSLQSVLFAITYDSGANFSTAFQNAHDSGFVFSASLSNPATVFVSVHESSSATNESFVYLDWSTIPAKFDERTVLHRQSDAVKHEPSRFLSDAKSATHFVGTHTVLAVGDHPNCDKPLVEWERGILEDGSHFRAELFPRMFVLAFPQAAGGDKAYLFARTCGADNALGPAPLNHEVEAVVSISEVQDGLLECSGFSHGVPHSQKYDRSASLSQVYYCPHKCCI